MSAIQVCIIGSGPAGYTAAIYSARAGLSPVLYTGDYPGGQLVTTNEVENFPGYPQGVKGPDMMMDLQKQAERFGTQIKYELITAADFSKYPFTLEVSNQHTIQAESVIIATGARTKYLGLPSEEKFRNKGVSACATCDGCFYRDKPVAVVGAGDVAAEESIYLSTLCSEVHMLVRRDQMRASKIMQDRVHQTPNIHIHWNTEVVEVVGDEQGVQGVRVKHNQTGKQSTLSISGFFLAIGHTPNTDIFKNQLILDEEGYIQVQPGSALTSVEGVFAVGDVADKIYRQAITAAGSGCMGAMSAEQFLSARRYMETDHAKN